MAGNNRAELEKVINHYKKTGETEKLDAAYFLIENMPDQFFYEGVGVDVFRVCFNKMDSIIRARKVINYKRVWDSLQRTVPSNKIGQIHKVRDIEVLTGDFLIKNIDLAFNSWNYPWNKDVSFENFCKYILPYKVKNESPKDFRTYFQRRYSWIAESLENKMDQRKVINLVNQDLKKWFYFAKLECPFNLSFDDLIKIKLGNCPQEVQIATYALRALGIPIAMEGVPFWANKGFRHDWNGWVAGDKTIPFMGTLINPGEYKLEVARFGAIRGKRAKIFRTTYEHQINSLKSFYQDDEDIPSALNNARYEDVTDQYVPVSDIEIKIQDSNNDSQIGYICVFNNGEWRHLHWGLIKNNAVTYSKMGRGIVYLPVAYQEKQNYPLSHPFVLTDDGEIKYIIPDKKKMETCILKKKYPAGKDNKIIPGMNYELFYWDNEWKSLGKQNPQSEEVIYHRVPSGALLWLRNLTEGFQERIFTWENNKQIWW